MYSNFVLNNSLQSWLLNPHRAVLASIITWDSTVVTFDDTTITWDSL